MKTKTTKSIMSAAAIVALAFTGATHATENLNIYCWSEYIPQDVIDDFSKETGIKVSVENYASNEEMLAKLGAGGGNYDIIQPSEYVVEALVKEKLLRPLDKKAVPNLKNIDPKFLNMPFDSGNKFSVPFMAGTVGIVVNTELVKEDIKRFSDVFKPANKGKIVVLDDSREIVSWALLSKGIPVNNVSDKNLEKAKEVLAGWLPLVKVYDSDSPKTALLNGDVAVGIVWGGEGAILLNENKKFRWIIPAEGTHLFIDSLAIPKTAKNHANAMKFMNYILQPEVSKKISDAFPYLNPNKEAVKLLTEDQRNNTASFPTEKEISKMETFKDIGERGSVIEELVTSLKVE
jgi:spermidine/putrescine transport system substrate-binding protein